MSAARKIWSTSWRVAVGVLLLLWIFHSIFVNEAREQSKCKDPTQCIQLVDRGTVVTYVQWQEFSRTEQWRLGWTYGPPALWKTLRSVHPGPFALSVLLMGTTLIIGIMRWRMVLNVHGLQLPFGRAAEISLVAHFFNSFLLGTAGGDVMKAYYAARETHHKKTEAVITVFIDRVIGLWAMLLFATAMIVPNVRLFEQPGLRRVVAVVVAMTVGATAFCFIAFRGGVSRRWPGARLQLRKLPKGEWLERTLDACREFGKQRSFVPRSLALSMILNLICVLQFLVVARGLEMNVGLLPLCLIVPTIICISALPISPAGLGVRENLFVQLLAVPTIAAHPTDALSLSLLAFAGSLFWGLVGGVVYLLFKQKHHLAEKELEAEP